MRTEPPLSIWFTEAFVFFLLLLLLLMMRLQVRQQLARALMALTQEFRREETRFLNKVGCLRS